MSYNYGSLQDYILFRQRHCKPISPQTIVRGGLYSSSYIWAENEYKKAGKPVPSSFFSQWDFFPLFICGETRKVAKNSQKKYLDGINLHFLPVPIRLEIVRNRKLPLPDSVIKEAIRHYRYEGIKRVWFVPKAVQEEMCLFYADTYFSSTYGRVTGQTKSQAKKFVQHYKDAELTEGSSYKDFYYGANGD